MRKKHLSIFLLFFYSGLSFSINCSLTKLNNTEKTICETPYLLEIDGGTNEFFSLVKNNSLSIGFLQKKQEKFLQERNKCDKDIECIQRSYIKNLNDLSNTSMFKSASYYFSNEIDEPFKKEIINKDGFTIKDNPWLVRFIFNETTLNFHNKTNLYNLKVVGDLAVDGNLYIFITAHDKENIYLIYFTETEKPIFSTVNVYKKSIYGNARITKLLEKKDGYFIFEISDYNDKSTSVFVKVSPTEINEFKTQEIKNTANSLNKSWLGFCDGKPCHSRITSTDGKYQIAEGGDTTEGIYLFESESPREGVNVFFNNEKNKEKINEGFTFHRDYAWGRNGDLFFDNNGGYACIWKTNINKKITERILPIEKLITPYYIHYNGNDYIVSRIENKYEFYISRKL